MIYNIIKQLEQNPSRNDKISILSGERDNQLFKKVLVAALDPTKIYYIKNIPEYTPTPNMCRPHSLEGAINYLGVLATREKTGHEAINHLRMILSSLNENDAKVIELIIKKDLKCGVGASTVNKVWKDLIPEYPYMRMSLLKDMKNVDWEYGMISQTKEDASFVNVIIKEGNVILLTRNGNQYDNDLFPSDMFGELMSYANDDCVIHGELIVTKNGTPLPRKDSNGLMNSIQSGETFPQDHYPVIKIWDRINSDYFYPKGKDNTVYQERLQGILDSHNKQNKYVSVVDTRWVYSMDEALAHYKENLALGLEGTILKKPLSIWKDGTSKDCYKLKLKAEVDLRVVGWNEGTGRNSATFGSLKCESEDGLLIVDVNGRGDDMRNLGPEYYMNKIITVESNGILVSPDKPNSLFLPIFVEVRTDKDKANTMPEIQEIFDNLVNSNG